MIRTKIKCELCGREISKQNYSRHLKRHENGNFDKINSQTHLDHDDLFCKYCGKECKNKNSLVQHEIRCRENPNRIKCGNPENLALYYINKLKNGDAHPWNKGLTKETDKRIEKLSNSLITSINKIKSDGKKWSTGKASTEEKEALRKKKISETMKTNKKAGGIRKGSGIGHKGYYKGFFCDSTYELVYVIYNLDHNIKFNRCNKFYEYEYLGEKHKYYPDFELDNGTLIEVKGYLTDRVLAKIESVKDTNIVLLLKKDLDYAFNYVNNNYIFSKIEDLYEKNMEG